MRFSWRLLRNRPLVVGISVSTLLGGGAAVFAAGTAGAGGSSEGAFNQPGNVLIADQFNNRVVELDGENDVVWSFGLGPNDVSAQSIVGVNDAQRVGSLTLMAGTGVPAVNPPLEPNCVAGCNDNRVILVNRSGQIVWQYGTFGVTGSGPNQLNTPVQATFVSGDNGASVLITDQGNSRVIQVSLSTHKIIWQYGTTGSPGIGANQLSNPNSAELLPNGDVLIADENNNRAIEVTHSLAIVRTWSGDYGTGTVISGVAFASQLPNGNILLTDSNNNRVLEIDGNNKVAWSYSTADPAGNASPLPTRAIRLRNGDTLISDQFNDRVIDVDHGTPATIIRQWGTLNVPGFGRNAFNAPYDAKVIGDYTGLTPPSSQGNS